ncbi:MAG: hypothetical protein KF883_01825 [Thermomicrobiales bacterium]|nr:hypothetical protein [Thermomicrobiales bacterium]
MDDRRFDDLTRVFASGVSRRSLVKWIGGVLGGGAAVAVHQKTQAAGLGEDCTTNADCDPYLLCLSDGDGTSSCRNNCQTGVDCSSSGDPSCCTRCCGGCDETGSCSAACSVDGHLCQPGGGHPYWFDCCSGTCDDTAHVCLSCLATSHDCTSDAQCCSGTCESGGCCHILGDTCPGGGCCGDLNCESGQCCAPAGIACGTSDDCCTGLVCDNGFCAVDEPSCLAIGDTCAESSECCSQVCDPDGGSCCVLEDQFCSVNVECCGDLVCSFQTCVPPCLAIDNTCASADECCSETCEFGVCCLASGEACIDSGCCGSLSCINGFCVEEETCGGINESCTLASECCTEDGLTCDSGTCCVPTEGDCDVTGDCCPSHICSSGECVPDCLEGAACAADIDCCETGLLCNASGFCAYCSAIGAACESNDTCCSSNCDDTASVCCLNIGASCNSSTQCCGTAACESDVCCQPLNATCDASEDCCGAATCSQGLCVQDCLESNVTNPACGESTPVCCEANAIYNPNNCECRVLCENGVSCFTDAHCDGDEFCSGGCCVPCLADGEGVYCATEQACCSHNCDMNNCGCRSIQSDCTDDEQCCSGICSDVEPRVCLPPDDTDETSCAKHGEYCSDTLDCCNDDPRFDITCVEYACVACLLTDAIPGRCVPGEDALFECCDPLALWNDQTCMCEIACRHKGADCSEDEDCCDGLQCIHGTCGKHAHCVGEKAACDEKAPCCKGYRCVDGHCKRKKRPPKSGGTDTVDTLPSTGAGPDAQTSGWTGAILAGSAAVAAAWVLRKDGGTQTDDPASRES